MGGNCDSAGYYYCEDCENLVMYGEGAPDGLCFECYADRLIDEIEDSSVRMFLSRFRYELISSLRGQDYD